MQLPFDPLMETSLMCGFTPQGYFEVATPSFTFSYMPVEDETRSYTVGYDIDYTVFALRSEAGDTLSVEGMRKTLGKVFGDAHRVVGDALDDIISKWSKSGSAFATKMKNKLKKALGFEM